MKRSVIYMVLALYAIALFFGVVTIRLGLMTVDHGLNLAVLIMVGSLIGANLLLIRNT